ncbi:hypothetical protein BAUCODRAFT_28127 [Baudoinia panamericana UAMH 10762]|uniref:ABC transporter domain-containing protein n=1 Tax=Baudoinia panamericana (strain UAMH 10762) TaxID=717646 RepID=M2LD70_BAUPA|nr:uncharacterized protein BAUCODRAFT_28127 [Baudoinia panamericana UAMH 10762]EMC91902.1 hypothetical protein BAUCODRAFT_28127 [Baudoinia panamericana UAMH 10762]
MWRRAWLKRRSLHARHLSSKPIFHIDKATFYRRYPSLSDAPGSNPPLLEDLSFTLPSSGSSNNAQRWSVISPSSVARTTFLQILAGQHICIPAHARSYPYLSEIGKSPQHAVRYVGFDADRGSSVGGTHVRGAYLSARYESRREETDFTVLDYLTGHTELNALERDDSDVDRTMLDEVTIQLNLRQLLAMPVANLSNGQTRRARIAKALMARPEVLLLDGPFMGLDPNTLRTLSEVLRELAERQQPRLLVSLRPEDGVPAWVSHLVTIDEDSRVVGRGSNDALFSITGTDEQSTRTSRIFTPAKHTHGANSHLQVSRDGFKRDSSPLPPGEAVVDMRGVKVAYGDKTVLGGWTQSTADEERPGLWWSLHRGQRCGIFGPNGSGKTTMLSLITSDHPQTYSLPIKLFGRSRLPKQGEPGISVFDIQRRMGHSSPEVHAFFPKQLTVKRALESAWADAPLSKPTLDAAAKQKVVACLRWFARELNPSTEPTALESLEGATDEVAARAIDKHLKTTDADLAWAEDIRFRELSFSSQRLVLFLRAIVASPDLVILDEALSGVDEAVRDKALLFLSHGQKISKVVNNVASPSMLSRIGAVTFEGLLPEQALLVISHAKEDVPGCIREWICLPEPGEGKAPRTGRLPGPLELNAGAWDEIWGR